MIIFDDGHFYRGDLIATGSNDKTVKLMNFNPSTATLEGLKTLCLSLTKSLLKIIHLFLVDNCNLDTQEPRATWQCTMEQFETAHLLRWVNQPKILGFSSVSCDLLRDRNLIWPDDLIVCSGWKWRCSSPHLGRSRWLQSLCHRLHNQHSIPGLRWS